MWDLNRDSNHWLSDYKPTLYLANFVCRDGIYLDQQLKNEWKFHFRQWLGVRDWQSKFRRFVWEWIFIVLASSSLIIQLDFYFHFQMIVHQKSKHFWYWIWYKRINVIIIFNTMLRFWDQYKGDTMSEFYTSWNQLWARIRGRPQMTSRS